MAFRPTRYVIEGELDNTKLGVVTGWIQFAGMKDKVMLELQGNFHRDIQGAKIRFTGEGGQAPSDAAEYMHGIWTEQKGKAGNITAGLAPFDYSRRPYIEWYSYGNGRVVIEPDPDHVEVIGQPVPLEQAVPVSPEEQAANMKEFMDTIVAAMNKQGKQSAGGKDLPPARGFVVMMGSKKDEQ